MDQLTTTEAYIAVSAAMSVALAVVCAYACNLWPFAPKPCIHPGCSLYEKPTRYCPDGHAMKAGYTGPIKGKTVKAPPPVAMED